MANDTIPDPTNVPGSEGQIPATDRGFRDDPAREDPAGVGVDDDGTNEAMGMNPLDPASHPTAAPDLDVSSHLVREIPDPVDDEETSDPA